jgi:hypothetical protein
MLAALGDLARDIRACEICHADAGLGIAPSYPLPRPAVCLLLGPEHRLRILPGRGRRTEQREQKQEQCR